MTDDKNIQAEEKAKKIRAMFDEIVPQYDLLNHVMSAWQDVLWRKRTVSRLPKNPAKVLDVATGTGDLAFETVKKYPACQVVGVDFSEGMLEVAKVKTRKRNLMDSISYQWADAMDLPFEDNEFDGAMIAFGLRNVTDRLLALKEMARVVRPGGRVLVLEMTFPENIGMRKFFNWYLNYAIPTVGGLISGNSKAYKYLPESIQNFLRPKELVELYREAGMVDLKAFPLSLGITYLHEGTVK